MQAYLQNQYQMVKQKSPEKWLSLMISKSAASALQNHPFSMRACTLRRSSCKKRKKSTDVAERSASSCKFA